MWLPMGQSLGRRIRTIPTRLRQPAELLLQFQTAGRVELCGAIAVDKVIYMLVLFIASVTPIYD